ncbi:MAG: hypothetical protein NTW19_08075 [Planctomycetota bacterium]|nr:hypothetical protein [Planctomycetota bacterium]
MFGKRKVAIRISPDLYDRAVTRARVMGLASVHLYVAGLIERDVSAEEEKGLRERVLRQMKSLGYVE